MTKKKELYTAIRYWEEGSLNGVDILAHSKNYSDLAKWIEERVETQPYCDWEREGSDADGYEIEDIKYHYLEPDSFSIYDIYDNAQCIANCRYREKGVYIWTDCWFYICASEAI